MCKIEIIEILMICAKMNNFVRENALMESADGDELQKDLQNRIEAYKSVQGATAGVSRALEDLKEIESEYRKLTDAARSKRVDLNEVIQQKLTARQTHKNREKNRES